MNSVNIKLENKTFHIITKFGTTAEKKIPVIFLHGFTGNCYDWEFIFNQLPSSFYPVAIDLPGHGKSLFSDNPNYYSEEFHLKIIEKTSEELKTEKFVLAGYSMGGRAALSYAVKKPSKLLGLFLESSTAGIEEEILRDERYLNDLKLADTIENKGINLFLDYWFSLPLFESLQNLHKDKLENQKTARKNNSPNGLANSLRGFSTGKMNSKWNDLKEMKIKTMLVSGELDTKFTALNRRMKSIIENSEHKIIPNCGHNIHLEKPNEFIILMQYFLKNLFK